VQIKEMIVYGARAACGVVFMHAVILFIGGSSCG
jgi:hypothetical protein